MSVEWATFSPATLSGIWRHLFSMEHFSCNDTTVFILSDPALNSHHPLCELLLQPLFNWLFPGYVSANNCSATPTDRISCCWDFGCHPCQSCFDYSRSNRLWKNNSGEWCFSLSLSLSLSLHCFYPVMHLMFVKAILTLLTCRFRSSFLTMPSLVVAAHHATSSLLRYVGLLWGLCAYVIVHTKLPPSSVIWIGLQGTPKWLPLPWHSPHCLSLLYIGSYAICRVSVFAGL